jgi:hypothetical protein
MWTKEEQVSRWQERLDIHYGMDKEQGLENFRAWREKKKTCIQCEGEKYFDYYEIKIMAIIYLTNPLPYFIFIP